MASRKRLEPLSPISRFNRLRRLIWNIGYICLYRPSPIIAHGWRRFVLRCFGATIKTEAHPYPGARIWAPWNLVMHEGSCIANDVDCYNVAVVEIGKGAIVSQKAYLCTASHDFDSPQFTLTGGPIVVGANAWVAADAFVGPSLTIGENAVVLARSVVVSSVAPGMVVGGNPGKPIRKRSSDALA